MKEQEIRSNMWRWWCGGGVIAIAVVLGCATAVEFKESGREAGLNVKRGVAGHGDEPHNGGKPTMPVTASFDDGESIQTIRSDKVLVVSITAEAEIGSIRGVIEGAEGLEGRVRQPLDFRSLQAGETQLISVPVPAKSGSLIVRINGVVNGVVNGETMDANLELKIINPNEVKAASVSNKPTDMTEPTVRDATGLRIQPMKATEN